MAVPADELDTRVDAFCDRLRQFGIAVETGVFGAHMNVALTNDGPVTFWLES